MTTFKDTNIKWLPKIPNDWEIKKLKYIFTYITGATPSSWKSEYYNWGKHNWITISDLDWKYTWKSKNTLTDKAVQDSNMKIVPKWSLLYSFKLSVWQMSFVSEDTYTNEAIFAVLEKDWLNLNFWYYALWSYFISNANENIYWAKIFNQFVIDNWFLIMPTLDTQTSIANFLDNKTDKISTFIKNKKETIKLLQEQKQAIIHKAVTKGIEEWVKMKDSWIELIWSIPYNWKVIPFSKYFISLVDYRWKTPEKVIESDYILITTKNIKWGIIDYSLWLEYITKDWFNISRSRWLPEYNDIVFTMEAPLWECAIIKDNSVAFWQRIIKLRLKDIDSNYAIYSMRSLYFQTILHKESTGSTVLWLKSSKIHKLKFVLPWIKEQKNILKYLDKETNLVDTAITKIESEIKLIEEYKDSLIYNAVTGKINI